MLETLELHTSTGHWVVLAPEIFLAAALCAVWVVSSGRFTSRIHDLINLTVGLTAVATVFSIAWLLVHQSSVVLFHDLVVVNLYTQAVKLFALLGVLPAVLGHVQRANRAPVQNRLLMITSLFFGMGLVSSNSLLTAYLNIEGLSIMLYVLAGASRSHGSSEAGLKYYGAGAAISAVLLLGLALTYQGAQAFELAEISAILWNGSESPTLTTGLRLVALSLLMKLATVPGHVWAPDVYEGVELSVTAFFATVSKVFVFAFAARLVYGCLGLATSATAAQNTVALALMAAASILIGCFGALGQITFKRFIAYASINQIGFLLIGLSTNTLAGIQATLHYLAVYMVAGVALFAALFAIERSGLQARYLSDLSTAFRHGAGGPVLLAFVAVLSMAGLPPFAGFFGKYALWAVLIDAIQNPLSSAEGFALSVLLFTSVLTSLFSMYYYLRVLKVAVFDQTDASGAVDSTISLSATGVTAGAVLTAWSVLIALFADMGAVELIAAGALVTG
jgi:NADH-quinone oxidoreductase subunit N